MPNACARACSDRSSSWTRSGPAWFIAASSDSSHSRVSASWSWVFFSECSCMFTWRARFRCGCFWADCGGPVFVQRAKPFRTALYAIAGGT